MICANSLANAKFLDDNRQTCDHLVDASMRTIKYRNVPQGGCIGPHISHVFFPESLMFPYSPFQVMALLLIFLVSMEYM
uniref:Uncharacterized protein n=1 Tax=Brassica oleracea var. oleracea TaxID=109376 RepID=A0A0D3AZS0_BRAOL